MPGHAAWMWLDLEDHGDFLGGFIPPDLPLLLRWRQGECVQAAVVADIATEGPVAQRVRLKPLIDEDAVDPFDPGVQELPALWSEFSAATWARG